MLLGVESGIEVVGEAGDGDEGAALAAACAPDVVLLDIRMPKRTGLEAWLCPDCREALEPVREPRCAVCGEPFDGAMTGPFTCSNCSGRRIAFDFAVAGALAAGPVREMIHRFKYQRDLSRRGALAELLRLALADPRLAALDPARWLLVPVPLHPLRQLWRGFNQSWELARTLAGYGATVATIGKGADFLVEADPILQILPMQVLVRCVAELRGLRVDSLAREQDDTKVAL